MYFTIKGLLWHATESMHWGIVAKCLTPGCEITIHSYVMEELLEGCSIHAFLNRR